MTEEPKKVAKGKKRDRGGIPLLLLPECKHKPTTEEKQNPLYCRYHKRCDHHTMDYYALRNIFHDREAKGDLVIKTGKRAGPRMRRPEMTMTFFIGHEDLMEEEAENMASSSSVLPPLVDEEMVMRIH